MPRSTHARRTKGGLPSSPDKIFQCLWGLEDYVHPRPGQPEPFLSLCLSFWPQMLFSLCKRLLHLETSLPPSSQAPFLPSLWAAFPGFFTTGNLGRLEVSPPTFPLPPPLCSSQTRGNDFSSRPPGLLPAPLPQPSQKRLRVEGFPFHFIFHHFYPFRMVRI